MSKFCIASSTVAQSLTCGEQINADLIVHSFTGLALRPGFDSIPWPVEFAIALPRHRASFLPTCSAPILCEGGAGAAAAAAAAVLEQRNASVADILNCAQPYIDMQCGSSWPPARTIHWVRRLLCV